MANYARITVAKYQSAKNIDQRSDNGHYMMTKQVRHEDVATQSHLPSGFVTSHPQIYSPTSAILHPKTLSKASRVPATAKTFAPTQQFGAIWDASVRNPLNVFQLTPTEQFEKLLNDDLEAKTKAEAERMKWYRRWQIF